MLKLSRVIKTNCDVHIRTHTHIYYRMPVYIHLYTSITCGIDIIFFAARCARRVGGSKDASELGAEEKSAAGMPGCISCDGELCELVCVCVCLCGCVVCTIALLRTMRPPMKTRASGAFCRAFDERKECTSLCMPSLYIQRDKVRKTNKIR
jgi:hypothetical protein